MTHPWDEVDRGAGGQYVKWEETGQHVKGTVARIGKGTDLNNNVVPEIDIDTDDGTVTISASQVDLKRKLIDALPNVGDHIVIVFTGSEKVGRGDMKRFDVAVKKGAGDGAATDEPALTPAAKPSAADLL